MLPIWLATTLPAIFATESDGPIGAVQTLAVGAIVIGILARTIAAGAI